MERVTRGLRWVVGWLAFVPIACSSPAPTAATGDPSATSALPELAPAAVGAQAGLQPTAGPAVGAAAPATGSAATPPSSPPASRAAGTGGWIRVDVVDAQVTVEGTTARVTAKARAPGAGWSIELRPLVGQPQDYVELEVVGQAPASTAPGPATEATVSTNVSLAGEKPGEVVSKPILIHGAGGAIFPK